MKQQRLLLGISGASGAPLALELLKMLREIGAPEVHLICSGSGLLTMEHETGLKESDLKKLADVYYDNRDIGAGPASGSFRTMGMVIVPCSMKTLAGIVSGYSDSLLLRAADVCMKERRRLILVPRECPLSTIHLRNLYEASQLGAMIIPPVPAYYNHPQTIQDVNRHIAQKILGQFEIGETPEWEGLSC